MTLRRSRPVLAGDESGIANGQDPSQYKTYVLTDRSVAAKPPRSESELEGARGPGGRAGTSHSVTSPLAAHSQPRSSALWKGGFSKDAMLAPSG